MLAYVGEAISYSSPEITEDVILIVVGLHKRNILFLNTENSKDSLPRYVLNMESIVGGLRSIYVARRTTYSKFKRTHEHALRVPPHRVAVRPVPYADNELVVWCARVRPSIASFFFSYFSPLLFSKLLTAWNLSNEFILHISYENDLFLTLKSGNHLFTKPDTIDLNQLLLICSCDLSDLRRNCRGAR